MFDDLFWEIHSGHSREGPGDGLCVHRALSMMTELARRPHCLDVGCGPGEAALQVAEWTGGSLIAVDTHDPFLESLDQAAEAKGLSGRIMTLNASMLKLPFGEAAFDLIWSEGAAYMMGFGDAVAAWKRFLKPGGYMAISEPCWTRPMNEVPPELLAPWLDEYPGMTTVDAILAIAAQEGLTPVGHFVLPPAAWWNYYGPLEDRIEQLCERYSDDAAMLDKLATHQAEIDGYRRNGQYYSYVFVVLRLPQKTSEETRQ